MTHIKTLITAVLLLVAAQTGLAVEPDEILDDPVLEARARTISAEVRCVVCQNESIDTSNAGIARDLRILIRERLVAGDSNQQVFDFLVARYGDFVLLRPPFKPSTYVLWLAPFAIIAFGAGGIIMVLKNVSRKSATSKPELDAVDKAELQRLIDTETQETSV